MLRVSQGWQRRPWLEQPLHLCSPIGAVECAGRATFETVGWIGLLCQCALRIHNASHSLSSGSDDVVYSCSRVGDSCENREEMAWVPTPANLGVRAGVLARCGGTG